MKSLLLATSILALTAGGAFAQGVHQSPSASGTFAQGMNQSPNANQAPGNGMNDQSSRSSGAMGRTGQSYGAQSSYQGRGHMQRIKEAQRVLKQDGLYKGGIDGKVGPETKTAVKKFQRQNGLRQTAQLDSRTMNKLLAQNRTGNDMNGSDRSNMNGSDSSTGASGTDPSPSRGIGGGPAGGATFPNAQGGSDNAGTGGAPAGGSGSMGGSGGTTSH